MLLVDILLTCSLLVHTKKAYIIPDPPQSDTISIHHSIRGASSVYTVYHYHIHTYTYYSTYWVGDHLYLVHQCLIIAVVQYTDGTSSHMVSYTTLMFILQLLVVNIVEYISVLYDIYLLKHAYRPILGTVGMLK